MVLTINETLERELETTAKRLNVPLTALVEALLRDSLSRDDQDFDKAVSRVLRKNEELYQRLA